MLGMGGTVCMERLQHMGRSCRPSHVRQRTEPEDGETDEGLHLARHQQHACKGFVRVKAHRLQLRARCSSAPRVLAPSRLQADHCRHTSWGSLSCTFVLFSTILSVTSGRWRGAQPFYVPSSTSIGRRATDDSLARSRCRGAQSATRGRQTRRKGMCFSVFTI